MTVLYAGLASGAVYALIALGYILTQTTANVLNFANAHLFVLAGFIGYWGVSQAGLPPALVFLTSVVGCALVALLEERLAIRPLAGADHSHANLITTVGAGTAITGAIVLIWGADPVPVDMIDPDRVWTWFGGRFTPVDLVLVILAVAVAASLHTVSNRTRVGLATLALAEDAEAARVRGIDTRRFALVGFVLVGALAGIIGPVIAMKTFASVSIALILAVKGFVALVIGGAGSYWGALVGGLSLGVVEAVFSRYLDPGAKDVFVFLIFMAVLLARPQGLFGQKEARAV